MSISPTTTYENFGALTTIFTAAPSCSTWRNQVYTYDNSVTEIYFRQGGHSDCYPGTRLWGYHYSVGHYAVQNLYYSPATVCPSGWETSATLATASVVDDENVYICCPRGWTWSYEECLTEYPNPNPTVRDETLDGFTWIQGAIQTTSYTPNDGNNWPVEIHYKASDVSPGVGTGTGMAATSSVAIRTSADTRAASSAAASPVSSGATADSPGSSASSSPPSLPTTSTASNSNSATSSPPSSTAKPHHNSSIAYAIGISVPLVVVVLFIIGFCVLRRRHKNKQMKRGGGGGGGAAAAAPAAAADTADKDEKKGAAELEASILRPSELHEGRWQAWELEGSAGPGVGDADKRHALFDATNNDNNNNNNNNRNGGRTSAAHKMRLAELHDSQIVEME